MNGRIIESIAVISVVIFLVFVYFYNDYYVRENYGRLKLSENSSIENELLNRVALTKSSARCCKKTGKKMLIR